MFRILVNGVFVVMVAFGTMPCFAQQAEPETQSDEAAEKTDEQAAAEKEGRVFKDKIVVTASRQEEESGNTPAPITVIDADTIEKIQPEKMADLFKNIPGVEIEGEGPFRGLPVIRGLSSNRVLILVDGQRLNNARESTTFAGIQPGLVNLSEVERIEVLRGPASVQYGSDAIGGVINIITRRPDLGVAAFNWDGEMAYEYGTAADSQNARVNVSGAGQGFSFQIGGAYQKADDYTAADGASESERFSEYVLADDTVPNSGMEQTSFDGSFRFLTGEQGVFRVNAEVVRTKDIGFPGFDPETSGIDFGFPKFDRDKIGLGWDSGPVWGLTDINLNAYYQQVDKETKQNFAFPGFEQTNLTDSKIDSFGFNAQGIADSSAHRLTFGLDFYRDKLDDDAFSQTCFGPGICPFPPSTEVSVPKSKQTGLGAYLQDRIALSEVFALQVGLRGDTFDFVSDKNDPDFAGEPFDVTDSAISGNVGVVWSVTNYINLNALVARGFRTPNLQERAFSGQVFTDTILDQNPDLSSETSLNYELGAKFRSDRFFGGVNFYYNDLKDFISYEINDELSPDGFYHGRLANIDKARIQGIELNFEAILSDWWTAFLTYAYTKGDNLTTDEPLSFMAPQKVLVGLRYQRARWWGEANARFVDRLTRLPSDDANFEEGVPGFSVYDLRGGYDFDFGLGFLVALGNITDKLYAEPFNNRPEPGRNLRVTARYRF
jgi:hemoglobin/transferrin/lactoferrin receptor protein